jgi:hypothetical protein
MKKSYFGIGVYESYLPLMDSAEKMLGAFGASEWFIVDTIQRYNRGIRSEKYESELTGSLKEKMLDIASGNGRIKIVDWNDIENSPAFSRIYRSVMDETSKGLALRRALRNVSATKLGVCREDKIIDSAFKYGAADMALTYLFAMNDYVRLLPKRNRELLDISRKYAERFGLEKGMIKSVDIPDFSQIGEVQT